MITTRPIGPDFFDSLSVSSSVVGSVAAASTIRAAVSSAGAWATSACASVAITG